MADTFTIDCPKCFATIRITDPGLIGRKIACPKCGEAARVRAPADDDGRDESDGGLFKISDEPKPQSASAVSDEPTDSGGAAATEIRRPDDVHAKKRRKKKKRKKSVPRAEQDLSGVRTGVFLLFFQAMVWVALFVFFVGYMLLTGYGKVNASADKVWLAGFGIVLMLAYVIGVIGKVFCLKAPESVGREFIAIALALEAIAFGIGLLTGLGVLTWGFAQLTSNVIGILASIMFLWFLSDLALHIDRQYLSEDALHIVGLGFGAFVVYFLVLGSTFFLGLLGVILYIIPLVMIILIFVRYITLIVRLNSELKQ